MKCKHRDILIRGRAETARMFSVCKNPKVIEQFKDQPVIHAANEGETTFVKLRCSLVCSDCQFREE